MAFSVSALSVSTANVPIEASAYGPYKYYTSPSDKSGVQYVQYDISAARAIQKLYRTSKVTRASRVTRTVSFADRVGHAVGRPRGFLHVPAQRVSAQIGRSLRGQIRAWPCMQSLRIQNSEFRSAQIASVRNHSEFQYY